MEIIAATAHPVMANSVQIDRQDARRNFKQRQLQQTPTSTLLLPILWSARKTRLLLSVVVDSGVASNDEPPSTSLPPTNTTSQPMSVVVVIERKLLCPWKQYVSLLLLLGRIHSVSSNSFKE
mmetsp:Transcript_5917/g.10593  ORF Transcript_5917/g.10593 Transcript_5917/m.10593 type:complete len:122 (-) Transcript_5917:605-970(-)